MGQLWQHTDADGIRRRCPTKAPCIQHLNSVECRSRIFELFDIYRTFRAHHLHIFTAPCITFLEGKICNSHSPCPIHIHHPECHIQYQHENPCLGTCIDGSWWTQFKPNWEEEAERAGYESVLHFFNSRTITLDTLRLVVSSHNK